MTKELLCAGVMLAGVTILPVLYLAILRGIFLADLRRQKYKEEGKKHLTSWQEYHNCPHCEKSFWVDRTRPIKINRAEIAKQVWQKYKDEGYVYGWHIEIDFEDLAIFSQNYHI